MSVSVSAASVSASAASAAAVSAASVSASAVSAAAVSAAAISARTGAAEGRRVGGAAGAETNAGREAPPPSLPPEAAQDYDQTQYKSVTTFFLMWKQQSKKKMHLP